jgi:hypothetical protein
VRPHLVRLFNDARTFSRPTFRSASAMHDRWSMDLLEAACPLDRDAITLDGTSASVIADDLELRSHPALAACMARVEACASHDTEAVACLVSDVRACIARESAELFPHIRAIERARNGAGPWPAEPAEALRARIARAARERALIERRFAELRSVASEELDGLFAVLDRHLRLVHELLYPRALELVPDRRRVRRAAR